MTAPDGSYPVVRLKPGREVPVLAGHPWIFSKGIETKERIGAGALVEVVSHDGRPLGIGTFHPGNTIRVRMLSPRREKIDEAFFAARFAGLERLKLLHLPPETDGYRLVHGDADGLPGLVVDVFGGVAVFQIHTAGMEPFRDAIVEALDGTLHPEAIVERSDIESRRQDRLRPVDPAVRKGRVEDAVPFLENGLRFRADVISGQKTGFFLDQRDARSLARALAKGRKVLNLFSYTSAFGLAAAAGGAESVTNVDVSSRALDLGRRLFDESGFVGDDRWRFVQSDVFDFFAVEDERVGQEFGKGLVVCDPPAFAKSYDRIEQAKKAYLKLNRICLEALSPGAVLLTCSCSGMLSAEDFREILRLAAGQAGRSVRVLGSLGQPFDHTQLLAFPEGRYLKVLALEVTDVDQR